MQINPFQPTNQTEDGSLSEVRRSEKFMSPFAFYLAGALVALGAFLILPYAKTLNLFLFVFSFAFGPLVLAMLPMWFWRSLMSQLVLMFAAIAYSVWFVLVYLTIRNARDPMAATLIFFVGPLASPFLLVLCGISLLCNLYRDQDS